MKCSVLKNQYVCPIKEAAKGESPTFPISEERVAFFFCMAAAWTQASQTNSTGLDAAILLTLRDCSSDFDLDFVIFSGSKLEKNTKDGSPDLPTVSVWDRKGGKGSKFTVGNISKILFWADRSNFCRSIYRFQPATVQSPEAESLYRRENNQWFQLRHCSRWTLELRRLSVLYRALQWIVSVFLYTNQKTPVLTTYRFSPARRRCEHIQRIWLELVRMWP